VFIQEALIRSTDLSISEIEAIVLSLSSIDFVDLLIEIEERLKGDFAEKMMTLSAITIGELAERILDYA